ncbi:hypothetical protein B0H19DRAFT_1087834 [Mycena capillaripes]|nr:hypothetical protein B0H19DRAFT_1087834 [Mycena capillaripes]
MDQELPLDLEREIFQTAAVTHPKTIPALLRVCHRVHAWVEPLLYRVLIITDQNSDVPLRSAVESKPATFLQSAVRHVFFITSWEGQPTGTRKLDSDDMNDLLFKCSGTINLMIDFNILHKMRLQRLDVMVPQVPHAALEWARGALMHPSLSFITHLSLGEATASHRYAWEVWGHLASLPALTHLALTEDLSRALLSQVLAECRRLLVAVTTFYSEEAQEKAIAFARDLTIRDPRVVVAMIADYTKDWETGARGGVDYWDRAEVFIDRKRRGEIENDCYFLSC